MTAEPREPDQHVTDARLDEVGERPVLVETPAGRLALVRRGTGANARIVAVDAWCPHIDGPLWEGAVSGDEIACPWHGWRYSLTSGACTWAPHGDAEEAAETEIRVLEVVEGVEGHAVVVVPPSEG